MDIYLKNEKENDTFHFPVNPIDELSFSNSKRFETVDIVDIGEVDLNIKGENIKEISFETLLPVQYHEFCRYKEIIDPKQIIAKLERWMISEDPLRLIITEYDFNDLVNLSELDVTEKTGEIGDKYISIAFRKYKELIIEEIKKSNSTPSSNTSKSPTLNDRTNTQSKSNTYTVVKGDSLWKIAKKFYGNGSKWKQIYDVSENKKIIGNNPDIIKVGQKLVIP